MPDFDPWTATPEEIAAEARRWQTITRGDLAGPAARESYIEWLLEVLQTKAALEAAALQADTARKLVLATWVLVGRDCPPRHRRRRSPLPRMKTTTLAVTTTTAYKLQPIDESLDADEANTSRAFASGRSLRTRRQPSTWRPTRRSPTSGTPYAMASKRSETKTFSTSTTDSGPRWKSRDSKPTHTPPCFSRAIFILCSEFRDATAALIEEN